MTSKPHAWTCSSVWKPLSEGALLRLAWRGQAPVFAWSHPEGSLACVGFGRVGGEVGAVRWVDDAPPTDPPGPWFGGFVFDAQLKWPKFPAEQWVLPAVLVWWTAGRAYAAAFGPPGANKAELLAQLDGLESLEPPETMPAADVAEGDFEHWKNGVEAALATPGLSKVVLARTLTVTAASPWPEARVFRALESRYPTCRTYLWRGDDGAVFIGATPETLCEIDGRQVVTEAIAGTAPSDRAGELLESEKDAREHALVIDGIRAALEPHCTIVNVGRRDLKRAGAIIHLRTPVTATLKDGVDPLVVAKALQPTPAVGGTPRALALDFIRRHERTPRGWYAGALGFRSAESVRLVVPLRGALIEGAKATLFVGAGLVQGSKPEAEWDETRRKARPMLEALGVFVG